MENEQEYFILNQQESIVESSKFPNNNSYGQIHNNSRGTLIQDQRQTFNPNDLANGFQIKKSSGVSFQQSDQINLEQNQFNLQFQNLASENKEFKNDPNEQQSFISAIPKDKDSSIMYLQNNNSILHNNSLFANSSQLGNFLMQGQSQLNNQIQKNNIPMKMHSGNMLKGFPSKNEYVLQKQQHKEQQERIRKAEQNSNLFKNSIDSQSQNNKQNIFNQFMRISEKSNRFQSFSQNNKSISQNSNQQENEQKLDEQKEYQKIRKEEVKLETAPVSPIQIEGLVGNSRFINNNQPSNQYNKFTSPIEAAMAFSSVKKL